MAEYVTNTSSADFSTPTHFTPNGTPGVGDTVIINPGHTLTIPLGVSVAIGTGSGTALTIGPARTSASGVGTQLVVLGVLQVRGHILGFTNQADFTRITVGSDAGIEMDGDPGFLPQIQWGHATGPLGIVFAGTAGHPGYLRTKPSKAAAGEQARLVCLDFDGNEYWGDSRASITMAGRYGVITDLGNASNFGVRLHALWALATGGTYPVLQNVDFVRTGLNVESTQTQLHPTNAGLKLQDVTFRETPIATASGYPVGCALYGLDEGGNSHIELDGFGFEQLVAIDSILSVQNGVFGDSWVIINTLAPSWFNVLAAKPGNSLSFLPMSSVTQAYGRTHFVSKATESNPYGPWAKFNLTGSITLTDWSFEAPVLAVGPFDDVCDVFDFAPGDSLRLVRPLTLPILSGPIAGTGIGLGTFGAAADSPLPDGSGVFVEHYTGYGFGDNGGVLQAIGGHGYGRRVFQEVRDSLLYRQPGNPYPTGHVFGIGDGSTDAVVAAGVHHNAIIGGTYNYAPALGTLGASDLSTTTSFDPQFVDPTRNFVTFWRTQVGATDPAYLAGQPVPTDLPKAVAYLVAHPRLVPTLIDWIRAGYVPQNVALATAASDGGTIGAMDFGSTPPPPDYVVTPPITVTAGTAGAYTIAMNATQVTVVHIVITGSGTPGSLAP